MAARGVGNLVEESTEAGSDAKPFAPVIVVPGSADSSLLLLCDHARNALPPAYGTLGLEPSHLAAHIAYDIGAEALTRALAERLDAPAVMATYSRLLIDPNRGENDPTLIVSNSDAVDIPGNVDLDGDERQIRMARYYLPYHAAIDERISAGIAAGSPPVLISIHSFTPTWRGVPRPWHVGILWDSDPDLARIFIDRLAEDPDIVVGDNEPYSGKAPVNGTLNKHARTRNLSHVLIEVRQDLIADADGVAEWADRLTPILQELQDEVQR